MHITQLGSHKMHPDLLKMLVIDTAVRFRNIKQDVSFSLPASTWVG